MNINPAEISNALNTTQIPRENQTNEVERNIQETIARKGNQTEEVVTLSAKSVKLSQESNPSTAVPGDKPEPATEQMQESQTQIGPQGKIDFLV